MKYMSTHQGKCKHKGVGWGINHDVILTVIQNIILAFSPRRSSSITKGVLVSTPRYRHVRQLSMLDEVVELRARTY